MHSETKDITSVSYSFEQITSFPEDERVEKLAINEWIQTLQ